MTKTTIWFNKGFSNLHSAIELIKRDDVDGRFRIICSHSASEFIGFLVADAFEIEPVWLNDDDYLEYCLDFCRRHSVDMFLPARRMVHLVANRDKFEAQGVQVMSVTDAPTLRLIENKAKLYDALLGEDIVPIPEYFVARDITAYDAAVAQLWDRFGSACVKPTESVFGLGFRVLTNKGTELDRLLNGDAIMIGANHLRSMLADAGTFRELIVMQYLEGQERSIDCLAHEGELVTSVIRLKAKSDGGAQLLEDNPAVRQTAEALTRRLGLSGLFNIQVRESGGIPYLLEINPRMSGGLPFACLAGVNIPYWAMRLAQGSCTADDIPQPETGRRVYQVTVGVLAGQ